MESQKNIKYLLLADITTGKQITEYSNTSCSKESKKIAGQIIEKVMKNPMKSDERSKIAGKKNEIYYFVINQENILSLVLADEKYQERLVFQLIDNIKDDNILLMVNDETKELNPQGRQALKTLIEKYQDLNNVDKIASINDDVREIQDVMKKNIQKQVQSMEDVENLEKKSSQIKIVSSEYANTANEIKRVTWWQNTKLLIIICVIILAIILAIVLPIVC